MIDITHYQKIQNMIGYTSKRERDKAILKQQIKKSFSFPIGVESVSINGGSSVEMLITDGKANGVKCICSKPDETFQYGDLIQWGTTYWIVTECDEDTTFQTKGKMTRCNYLLKWQNADGEIISRHAIIASASKYNDGEDDDDVLIVGSDQLSICLHIDDECLKVKNGTKFFIDNNTLNPTTYELTGTNNVAKSYDEVGYTTWIAKECAYSPTDDDLLYGVCNYSPTTTTDVEEGSYNMLITMAGKHTLRMGGATRTISAKLDDGEGNEVADTQYVWTVTTEYLGGIDYSTDGGTMVISANDTIDHDFEVTIGVCSRYTGQYASITLPVLLGV